MTAKMASQSPKFQNFYNWAESRMIHLSIFGGKEQILQIQKSAKNQKPKPKTFCFLLINWQRSNPLSNPPY